MGQQGIHRKRNTDNVDLPFLRFFFFSPLSFCPPSFGELALPTNQAQSSIQKEPQVLSKVLTWDPCLNRGQEVCISKKSCSRSHTDLSWSQLQSLLQWLYKLSELCEIFSWEASSSGWHQPSSCFYSTLAFMRHSFFYCCCCFVFFLVVCFWFLETGFLHVALAVLELTLYTGLASNSKKSPCLCFKMLGLKIGATTTPGLGLTLKHERKTGCVTDANNRY